MEAPSSFFTARAATEGVIDGDCCVNKDHGYERERADVVNQSSPFRWEWGGSHWLSDARGSIKSTAHIAAPHHNTGNMHLQHRQGSMWSERHQALAKLPCISVLLMGIEPRPGNCLIYFLLTSFPDTCLNLHALS